MNDPVRPLPVTLPWGKFCVFRDRNIWVAVSEQKSRSLLVSLFRRVVVDDGFSTGGENLGSAFPPKVSIDDLIVNTTGYYGGPYRVVGIERSRLDD